MPTKAKTPCPHCHKLSCSCIRTPARQRGYDNEWKKLRNAVYRESPLCKMCLSKGRTTPGEIGHHITPVNEAPELRLDPDNIMMVCRKCHGELHKSDTIY